MSKESVRFDLKDDETGHEHPAEKKISKKAGKAKQIRMNVMVDEKKHKKFKIKAIQNGLTMSEIINSFLDFYLTQPTAKVYFDDHGVLQIDTKE